MAQVRIAGMKTKKPTKQKKPRAAASKPRTQPINGVLAPRDNRAAIALFDKWMRDDSGYDEAVWPEIKAALERNRSGQRRLFRD